MDYRVKPGNDEKEENSTQENYCWLFLNLKIATRRIDETGGLGAHRINV